MTINPKLTRRQILKLIGASGAATLAAGFPFSTVVAQGEVPAPDISAKLTIFNFGGEAQQEVYKAAIARFNERYPNVTVEDIYTPFPDGWGQFITQLRTRVASGLPVDIIAMAIEGVQATISQDLLIPLDDYIAADPEAQTMLEDVHPSLHDALKGADGTTYYLTREWNNMIIHYNTQMFEEAGLEPPAPDWTWDQFLETARTLTTGEGENKVFGFAIPYFNFGLAPWFHTNGTSTLTADWTDSNLNDPNVLESVKFIHSLVHEHGVSPAVEGNDPFVLFSSGRAAMTGGGRWPFAGYIANDFSTVDIQNWPRQEAGTTVFGSGGWAITKSTQNPDLAWQLMKDLTSFDTDKAAIDVGTSLPARRSVAELPEFNEFPKNARAFFASLDDIKPIPSPPNFAEVESIFMRHLGAIMANSETPEAGLEAAHQELSAAMAKLR
jgi:multiple sugar transport system substrate-binding protein